MYGIEYNNEIIHKYASIGEANAYMEIIKIYHPEVNKFKIVELN